MEEVDGLKTGEGQLGNIDFGEFKKVNDELNELEQKRADRLATLKKKSQPMFFTKDSELRKLKEKEIQGAKETQSRCKKVFSTNSLQKEKH